MPAITAGQTTVDATVGGVEIVAAANYGRTVHIRNNDTTATNTAVLGPSGVATGTGYILPGGSTMNITLKAGQSIYGIRGTANSVVVSYVSA